MNITIFNDVTTESALVELEAIAAKYEGLFVEMDDKEQRKFVKDKASDIQRLRKQLDRRRIDESANYKTRIDTEASAIDQRLISANEPFQCLINQYKRERAKILADKKAAEDAIQAAQQFELDHENAIMENKIFELERESRELFQLAAAKQLAKEAKQAAIDELKAIADKAEADKAKADAARLANIEHVTNVCSQAKSTLVAATGLTNEQAIDVIKAIRSGLVNHVTIKF